MIRCFLISNMYPTQAYPGYGSFVKNVCDGLIPWGIQTKYKAVIRGRANSILGKVNKYIKFYFDIFIYYFRSYDFIYIHFPNQAVPILILLSWIKRRKIIVNFHGEDLLYVSHGISGILGRMTERFCQKYVCAVVVPSSYYQKIIISRNFIEPHKIIVSPSGGVNPQVFYPADEKSVLDDVLRLGYVGRLEKDKGVWEAIFCCERIKEKQSVHLTIIGYGSCYEEIQNYIQDYNLSDVVQVIPGVQQKELGEYYRQMDLFIFCSSRTGESLGLTGIEAMACGVPVIGSKDGGIATYVVNKKNGYLVVPTNVTEIVQCIEEYNALPLSEKQKMRESCIKTSNQYLTPSVMKALCQRIIDVLE